jgi:hypothetical protein
LALIVGTWQANASSTSDNVPGLVTESRTFETLPKRLRTLVPELLELNGVMPKSGRALYRVGDERHYR